MRRNQVALWLKNHLKALCYDLVSSLARFKSARFFDFDYVFRSNPKSLSEIKKKVSECIDELNQDEE